MWRKYLSTQQHEFCMMASLRRFWSLHEEDLDPAVRIRMENHAPGRLMHDLMSEGISLDECKSVVNYVCMTS